MSQEKISKEFDNWGTPLIEDCYQKEKVDMENQVPKAIRDSINQNLAALPLAQSQAIEKSGDLER